MLIFRTISVMMVFSVMVYAHGDAGLKPGAPDLAGQIRGVYTGTLFSSGYDMPVETTFYYSEGQLVGEYVMDENGTLTPGLLTRITVSDGFTVNCTWIDKYGEGPASFTFSHGFSSFTGWWGTETGEGRYSWWGSKEQGEILHPLRN